MVDPPTQLADLLSCAALDADLRGIVLYDAPPHWVHTVASWLAQLIMVRESVVPDLVTLTSGQGEDVLWGRYQLSRDGIATRLAWQPGLLSQPPGEPSRVIQIFDLARIGLAAERAAITLVGTPEAVLERRGQSYHWQPRLSWIAACHTDQIGVVSPHLLDRFALRLRFLVPIDEDEHERAVAIRSWGNDGMPPHIPQLSKGLLNRVAAASSVPPRVPNTALTVVQTILRDHSSEGVRRELALARLARALAWLEGSTTMVEARHVLAAANMIGISTSPTQAPPTRDEGTDLAASPTLSHAPDIPISEPASVSSRATASESSSPLAPMPADLTLASSGVVVGEGVSPSPQSRIQISSKSEPFPEDVAPVLRDHTSLRLLSHRYRADSTTGPPIDSVPADDLHDLDILSTVLEAAKFQRVRHDHAPADEPARFRLARTDLRRYRRAVHPEQILIMVLDYTCLRNSAWENALLPHLSWAYTERASIFLVQVGVRDAVDPLRAQVIAARRLLTPELGVALAASAGGATPLAHGLELASFALRDSMQRGRGTASQARLVVLSDGRGNVPLKVSHSGHQIWPVGLEGVDDALIVARQIAGLKQVDAVLIDPMPKQYPELPQRLARALGAVVEPIADLQVWP